MTVAEKRKAKRMKSFREADERIMKARMDEIELD